MEFVITAHAQEMLKRRNISRDIVFRVLDSPEQIVPISDTRTVYQSKITTFEGKIYLVRVVVDKSPGQLQVVTAYKTSKIDKYWSLP